MRKNDLSPGQARRADPAAFDFLGGGGEMTERMLAVDWRASPLGAPEFWPVPLKTLLGLMLRSAQPMFMAWGGERTWFYNDAFIPILGRKHPRALGKPSAEVWSEAWESLEPMFDRVFAGESVHMDDINLQLDRHGKLEEAHFAFSYNPVGAEGPDRFSGLFGVCTETTAQVMADRRQAAATARQRRQFEQAPGFIIVMSGAGHVVDFVNNAHRRLFGSDEWIGKTIRDAFPSIAGQGFYELLDGVYQTGETYAAHGAAVRYQRTADGPEETRYLDFIFAPVTGEDGRVEGIFCEGFDVTEARRLEEQRLLLTRELEHRMKNVLAMVGAIVNQSFRGATSVAEVHQRVANRISVLAHAHEMLTQASWTSAPIRNVVEGALAPHRIDGTRFRVQGQDLMLPPKAALSLALVINELATNAAKYGALSVPSGHVDVGWEVSTEGPEPIFRFDWREVGGPAATKPERTGFGLRLIQRSLADDFPGKVGIDFTPEGLHCFAETPLASLQP